MENFDKWLRTTELASISSQIFNENISTLLL
jgi:hypothetical protein